MDIDTNTDLWFSTTGRTILIPNLSFVGQRPSDLREIPCLKKGDFVTSCENLTRTMNLIIVWPDGSQWLKVLSSSQFSRSKSSRNSFVQFPIS